MMENKHDSRLSNHTLFYKNGDFFIEAQHSYFLPEMRLKHS